MILQNRIITIHTFLSHRSRMYFPPLPAVQTDPLQSDFLTRLWSQN